MEKVKKVCEECGKAFLGYEKKRFCSQECRIKNWKKRKENQ